VAGRVVIFGWAESAHIRRWVPSLIERGFTIRLISLGGEPIPGTDTICLPREGNWSYFAHSGRAARLARQFKPDLIHVHYAGGFSFWGLRTGIAPMIVSVWGADVIDIPNNPVQRWLVRRALRKADRVTATSRFLRSRAINLAPKIAGKTEVIPFGVNVPDRVEPLPPGPIKLCFIKSHRPKYGPDLLLRAMARVRETNPEVTLTLAGKGEMTAELQRLAGELGLDGSVWFAGMIPNSEMYAFIQKHHIMVMPSVMESESFGVAVLEASACGRPVIASRIGGVPEVLENGETGLMVPAGEIESLARAILELAGDPARCEAMGRAGRTYVRDHYRWANSVDRMSNLYRELIDG
jgi:glycosyltransferase involved in cell wall biosynthesis